MNCAQGLEACIYEYDLRYLIKIYLDQEGPTSYILTHSEYRNTEYSHDIIRKVILCNIKICYIPVQCIFYMLAEEYSSDMWVYRTQQSCAGPAGPLQLTHQNVM
jgi:hypothetical protein